MKRFCFFCLFLFQSFFTSTQGQVSKIVQTASGAPAIRNEKTTNTITGNFSTVSMPDPVPPAYPAAARVNYVRTFTARMPEQDPGRLIKKNFNEVCQSTCYLDGLGRLLQLVTKQGSLKTGSPPQDLVTAFLYDRYGRQTKQYLSFPASETGFSNGGFKNDPFREQSLYWARKFPRQQFFCNNILYDASPLGFRLKDIPPGDSWGHPKSGISYRKMVNTMADSVRIWKVNSMPGNFGNCYSPGMYLPGSLFKLVVTDEQGNQTIELKDKSGNTILKKVQLSAIPDNGKGAGHEGWLCTYFMYDELGLLHTILQPEGVKTMMDLNWKMTNTVLAEQCFRYAYDKKQRLVLKQIPGAAFIQMVYDAAGRLVLLQDGNMRKISNPQWYYISYDQLNRPVSTGIWYNRSARPVHESLAAKSNRYPVLTATDHEELGVAHYDDYENLPPGFSGKLSNTDTRYFFTGPLHTAPEFAEPWVQSLQTKGLPTWTQTKIPGTSSSIVSVKYYDEKGLLIQEQIRNITGAISTISYQYNFSGQVIKQVQRHVHGGKPAAAIPVCTKNTWDELGRLRRIEKRFALTGPFRNIAEYEYDETGQLMRKKIGTHASGTGPLETLEFDYHLRGWLLGVNRDFVTGQVQKKNFGYSLSYDSEELPIPNLTMPAGNTRPTLDGNISSICWKSAGDGHLRRYDLRYDAANRLLMADFNQLSSTSFNKSAGFDFSLKSIRYDRNGNLVSLSQKGWKPGGSQLIDSLCYRYFPGSNKVQQVADLVNDTATSLGDFRSSGNYLRSMGNQKTTSAIDYSYDENGNLVADKNKDLVAVTWNCMNLPVSFDFGKQGNIRYVWTGDGTKVKKLVTDSIAALHIETLYLDGAVYESKQHFVPKADDYKDSLLYFKQEEGVARWKKDSFCLDFFIKDHQSNTRMVLTEEKQTDNYPAATMEPANNAAEERYYSNIAATRVQKPTGYPASNTTTTNDHLSMLQGNDRKPGPGILLKVMSGDRFSVSVNSWYRLSAAPAPPVSILPLVTSALAAAIPGITADKWKASNLQALLDPAALSFLQSGVQSTVSGKPVAFLNFLLLDEQLMPVITRDGKNSGAHPVGGNNELYNIKVLQREITSNGYLFIFLSNATTACPVYFDNLQVTHHRGPLLEENHYYPFGLLMHGISSRAHGTMSNRVLHAGRELQVKEFNTGTGLQLYDFNKRMYDVQTGRWLGPDGAAEKYPAVSPRAYAGNNPVNIKELNGNLFVFASGFMLSHYLKGSDATLQQRQQQLMDKGTYMSWYTSKPNLNQYAPDRDFFRALPRNNGQPFSYWEGVDNSYRTFYKDNNAYYINGSFTPQSQAKDRFSEGVSAGKHLISKLDAGEISLTAEETIKVVGHSQGAAFAAGIATELAKHAKYGSRVEFVDYIAPHQPGDFSHPSNLPGRQFSTATDKVSSGYGLMGKLLNLLNGGSSLEKIDGVQDGLLRLFYPQGKGGHYVDTWAEDLARFFEQNGVKVIRNF